MKSKPLAVAFVIGAAVITAAVYLAPKYVFGAEIASGILLLYAIMKKDNKLKVRSVDYSKENGTISVKIENPNNTNFDFVASLLLKLKDGTYITLGKSESEVKPKSITNLYYPINDHNIIESSDGIIQVKIDKIKKTKSNTDKPIKNSFLSTIKKGIKRIIHRSKKETKIDVKSQPIAQPIVKSLNASAVKKEITIDTIEISPINMAELDSVEIEPAISKIKYGEHVLTGDDKPDDKPIESIDMKPIHEKSHPKYKRGRKTGKYIGHSETLLEAMSTVERIKKQ
jgi:hypothetical protein